ncbi:MAG: DNA-processing protein DprA [Chloroflexota bacterium]|nr:DNA-processing protein DprA [Chloroflexota bacterium]
MVSQANDSQYWVAFNRIAGIGRVRYSLLEKHFGRLENAWTATPAELRAAGLDEKTASAIAAQRPKISPEAEMERLARHGVRALTWNDPAYPSHLKEIYDLPPVLYVRGEVTEADEWAVAVVGTRRPTPYGRQVAEYVAADLAAQRITIVSGLARGIDAIAHRAALDSGGRTIAVMACGLDMVYPPEHLKLAQEVRERGALVSDYPLGTQPRGEHFPRRNRIMSGLSLGVLVVEGDLKSGALITASLALEQNREVFAVPGSIFSPQSRGPHRLLQEGAKLVQTVQDILEELNLTMVPQQMEMKELVAADDTEKQLLRHISTDPIHIDEVRRRSGLPIATVSSALAMLELKGLVRQMGRMNYVRAREAGSAYRA